jgi:hypothetical protein
LNRFIQKILFTPKKTVLSHFVLGLILAFLPQLFIGYFYIVFILLGLWIFSDHNTSNKNIYIIGAFIYLMLFESVSRLLALDPFVPWELGKYLLLLLIVLMIVRGKVKGIFSWLIVILLVLIMIFKGITWKGFFFNATIFYGLILVTPFFNSLKFTFKQALRIFEIALLPLVVFLGSSINQIQDFQNRQYELGSNSILDKIPSNQVATYMGFGLFISIIPIFFDKEKRKKPISYLLPAAFLFVGLLSFSRGGMVTAIIALVVLLLGNILSGKLNYLVYSVLAISLLVPIVLFVNGVTGGTLFLRYQGETRGTLVGSKEKTLDTYTTGRVSIFIGDWETFLKYPVAGVEVGESKRFRQESEKQLSHVELSRVLAEHGIVGLLGFLFLVQQAIKRFRLNSREKRIKYFQLAVWLMGFLTTFHGATRTIVPFIGIVLGYITIVRPTNNLNTKKIEE